MGDRLGRSRAYTCSRPDTCRIACHDLRLRGDSGTGRRRAGNNGSAAGD